MAHRDLRLAHACLPVVHQVLSGALDSEVRGVWRRTFGPSAHVAGRRQRRSEPLPASPAVWLPTWRQVSMMASLAGVTVRTAVCLTGTGRHTGTVRRRSGFRGTAPSME